MALVGAATLALGCGGGDGATDDPDNGDNDDGTTPDSPLVDPDCVDGQFSEVLPDLDADISGIVAGFDAGDPEGFVSALLAARYPFAAPLVEDGYDSPNGNCLRAFGYDLSSAAAIIGNMSTIVHECGHFADGDASGFGANTYYVNSDLTLELAQGDATDRGGLTFARSRIKGDDYQPSQPACTGFGQQDCDVYAYIYLDGDPDDGTFDGGDQGFNMLFEETVQYVNSLASSWAFVDQIQPGSSSSQRDGILNFLWFVERYLRMARLEYPDAYAHLLEGDDGKWRRAILQVWGRAWLYLGETEGVPGLGIDDEFLTELVSEPELVEEIQRLRDAEGC
jgi:hypothetical protein